MVRGIGEKTGNFAKFSGKFKFLTLKKFSVYRIRTSHLRNFGILPT